MNVQLSVIVVCYNEAGHIDECVDALLGQLNAPLFELLIVDGGSTDSTRQIIARKGGPPTVRLLDNPRRYVAYGRNIGWRASTAPYVAFTDADVIVPPDWLATLWATMAGNRERLAPLAAVGGGNTVPDEPGFYSLLRLLLSSGLGDRGSAQTKVFPTVVEVRHLPTLNVLYATSAIQQIGGFDEQRFPSVGEDEDLSTRLRNHGYRLLFTPEATVVHRQRSDFRSWGRNMWLYGFGRMLLMRRHASLRRLRDFAVLLAPLSFVAAVGSAWWVYSCAPAGFYVATVSLAAALTCIRNRSLSKLFPLIGLMLLTHLAYSGGLLKGALHMLRSDEGRR